MFTEWLDPISSSRINKRGSGARSDWAPAEMQNTFAVNRTRIIIFLSDLLAIAIMISFKITWFCAFQNPITYVSA